MEYHSALLLSAHREKNITINAIPADSTFGQWWGQLHAAFQSSEVLQWVRDKGIDMASITLDPQTGQLFFRLKRELDPQLTLHTVGQEDSHWAAISEPILQAARVIGAGTSFAPPATQQDAPVPWWIVGRFYQEPQGLTETGKRARAQQIEREQGFKPLDPDTAASVIKSRSEDALQEQRAFLADIENRHVAAGTLRHLAGSVENGIEYVGQIRDELKKPIDLSSEGTYRAGESNPVSLSQFLQDHGWDIPTTHEQLLNLATALSTPALKVPTHGNLGGALAWPVPLDQNGQEQLRAAIRSTGNVLDYLLDGRPLSAEQQRNPRALIDELIHSPKGKALGQALQDTFEARAVKGSATDWLLAALSVGRSRGSDAGLVIEGFRLVSAENTGKSPSMVVKALSEHLAANGTASSPQAASIQARLMLAHRAPEFLVEGIPDQVVVGTHSWVSFATAVARIEADAPGATATMNYAQVMLRASVAPITDDQRRVELAAQNAAIKEWAVANGMGYPLTEAALTAVRNAFDAQISELREAAETQVGELPTTRAIALEQLRKALPGIDRKLLEEKSITSQPSNRHFPGPYSLLDLFIDGRGLRGAPDSADDWGVSGRKFVNGVTLGQVTVPTDGAKAAWVSSSSAIDINDALAKIKDLPRPQAAFDRDIARYAHAVRNTTSAQLKHLIAKLPLEDRQNLEFGKVTVRREFDYNRNDHLLRVAEGILLIETERDGRVMTYEVDRLKGTVTRQPGKTYEEFPPTEGFYRAKGKKYEVIKPAGEHPVGITAERQGPQGAPNSFGSARTQYIADALIADMDLPAVQRYAKGATTFETEVPTYKTVQEVALNLIPFRSAIKHFSEGNVGDGVVDLAFDIFGFAVGLGAAAKGAKALSAGASALSKAGQGLKIVGRAAVGALNPLGGIDDLAKGLVNGVRAGAGAAYTGVKQLRGSYRSVNLLALAKKPDIAEGTYKAAHSASDVNALARFDDQTGKWFAYNPNTHNIYGKALEGFKPHKPSIVDNLSGPSLLETGLAKDNVIQLGSAIKEFKVIDSEVHVFYDVYKGTDRLNIVAHGKPYVSNKKIFSRNNADIEISGKAYSAEQLVALLKLKGVDPQKFDSVRLMICHSAEGGSKSFGGQLQKAIKKPVKAFEGTVTTNFDPTTITHLRDNGLLILKQKFPGITDAYAQMLSEDFLRSGYVDKLKPKLFKKNGELVEINVAPPGAAPKLVKAPVVYKPKKFGPTL